jgi:hypothetical protein
MKTMNEIIHIDVGNDNNKNKLFENTDKKKKKKTFRNVQ